MKIVKSDLQTLAHRGVISTEQVEAIWSALGERVGAKHDDDEARFDLSHVAFYFGALIVIGAFGWFMSLGWETLGGGGLMTLAITYALFFFLAGRTLWHREGLRTPGGLLITVAVCMTPLAIYGFERMTGLWVEGDPGNYRGYYVWVRGSWLLMEVGTIIAASIALRYFPFSFLTAPIAFSLWFMSMDVAPLVFKGEDLSWNERLWVSLIVGAGMIVGSYMVDRRTRVDYAFWGYLFGTLAFWGGLSLMNSDNELGKFFYLLINIGLILLSVLLARRVFIVFGSLGVFYYLGHLAWEVFEDSLFFPFALSFVGILIIALGVFYQRHQAAFEARVRGFLPDGLRDWLPQERG